MVLKSIWATLLFTGLATVLLTTHVAAENISISSTNYTPSLTILHQALAPGPVLADGVEKHAEAAPLSVPTGAWLISIGLIGFIVSRQRFRKKDD